jgi:hypothetical protein
MIIAQVPTHLKPELVECFSLHPEKRTAHEI